MGVQGEYRYPATILWIGLHQAVTVSIAYPGGVCAKALHLRLEFSVVGFYILF